MAKLVTSLSVFSHLSEIMPYRPKPDTCLAFLVRHGATANNLARPPRIQGHGQDLALSAEGRQQAEKTARFLTAEKISVAYTSPLARARETAQIIADPHHLVPVNVDALQEVDVGRWEGKSWMEIESEQPEAYRKFVTDPSKYGYEGGENLAQVQQRVVPCIQQLMRDHLGQCILIVAHNVVNRTLLATLLNVPLARARGVDQDNCGVNLVRFRAEQMKVLTVNTAFHLQ